MRAAQQLSCPSIRSRAAWPTTPPSHAMRTPMAPRHVGLYIGSLRSLGHLERLGITHVLSVINFELTRDLSHYVTLRLPLHDDEGANLLAQLPAAYAFIHSGLTGVAQQGLVRTPGADGDDGGDEEEEEQGVDAVPPATTTTAPGKVLVHCQAGQSRSAAVVAAYLMKSRGMDDSDALSLLRSRWPSAEPNEGFVAQLSLFSDMRCSLDAEHPVFRLWCLKQVGKQYEEEGWVDPDAFATSPQDAQAASSKVVVYRCRKCRRLLASGRNVMPVDEVAVGHTVFRDRKSTRGRVTEHQGRAPTGGGGGGGGDEGSSMFLEPMDWMVDSVVGTVQGKLYCPGCNARLGSFNWAGITNEAGLWITPAFQIHTSRVDALRPPAVRPLLAQGAGVARPQVPLQLSGPGVGVQGGPPQLGDAQQGTGAGGVVTAAAAQQPAQQVDSSSGLANAVAGAVATLDSNDIVKRDGSGQQAAVVLSKGAVAGGVESSSSGGGGEGGGGGPWFTTLILDCDGVMVDSERPSCEALRRAILQVTGFDIPHEFPHDYYEVFGRDVYGCLEHYKNTFNRSEWVDLDELARQVQEAKEGIYMQLTHEMGIKAFPGAAPLIQEARRLGLSVGIGSSGAPAKIRHNLESCGLLGLVEEEQVVSAAYVARGKPSPDVYVECLRRLSCSDPRRAIVVEDAVNGLLAARGAGAFAVGVTTSLPAARLQPWADLVVDDLMQLVDRLATIRPQQLT